MQLKIFNSSRFSDYTITEKAFNEFMLSSINVLKITYVTSGSNLIIIVEYEKKEDSLAKRLEDLNKEKDQVISDEIKKFFGIPLKNGTKF